MYMSEITHDDEEQYADAEEGYAYDTLIDMIQTNFHNSTRQANVNQRVFPVQPPAPNNTRLPSDVCSYIPQYDRLTWIKLSRETKALKLGIKPPPETNNKGNRKSMLHDISTFEFITNIDDT